MSGQEIGTVVGGVVGAYFGMPQLGMAIGGMIGGAIDPTVIQGPHIGDGQVQTATDGSPIAWVMGTATIAGTIVQVGPRREVSSGGKGSGTVQETYSALQDFAILVCESSELRNSTIDSVLMVQEDGKLVYDVRPGSTILEDSAKWISNKTFLFGAEDQMPNPTLEAISGVGNTPAYRGSLVMVVKDENITQHGNRIPQYLFTVSSSLAAGLKTIANVTFNSGDYSDTTGRTWTVETGTISDRWGNNTVSMPIVTTNMSVCPDSDNHDGTFDYRAYANFGMHSALEPDGLPANVDFTVSMDVRTNLYTDSDNTSHSFMALLTTNPDPNNRLTCGARIGTTAPLEHTITPIGVTRTFWSPPNVGRGAWFHHEVTRTGDILSCWYNGTKYAEYSGAGSIAFSGNPAIIVGNGGGSYESTLGWPGQVDNVNITAALVGDTALYLADVVSKICARGGLSASDIDTSDLATTEVQGYPIAKQMTGVDALRPLLQAYFAYASDYDAKLWFRFYGADTTVTVDSDDLVQGSDPNDPITSNLRNNATEFPLRFIGSYYDPAQNYMPVQVTRTRSARDVIAVGDQTFSMPVVMKATNAIQAIDKAMKVAYATLEGTLEYSVPFAGKSQTYLTLSAGDPLQFQGKRWVVDEAALSQGYMKLTTRYDRQSAYTSSVQPILGLDPTPPASPYSGPTTLIPMNLPQLQTQDGYGLYLVAGPVDATTQNWRGCNVQMSLDSGATWQTMTPINVASTYGALTAADTGTTLVAQMNGDLESVGTAQLDARQNAAALLHGTAAEVLQFGTATEDPVTADLYTLTDLRRAQLGTAQITGAIGDQLVTLDNVVLLPIDIAFAGQTIQLRGVGFGEDADSATVVSIVYNPDTTVIHDGGTVT